MTTAMMDLFAPLIEAMMREPPDPNDIPASNRRGVAMGVTIPFHVRSKSLRKLALEHS